MMASQELTIRRTAPQQKNLMRVHPVAFGFFLFRFPAGLFVYDVLTFCQNLIVYRAAPRTATEGTPIPEADAAKADSINADTGDAPPATTRRRKKTRKRR